MDRSNETLKEQVSDCQQDRDKITAAQAGIDKLRQEGVTAATVADLQNDLDKITSSQALLDKHAVVHKLRVEDNARRREEKHRRSKQARLDMPRGFSFNAPVSASTDDAGRT